MWSHEKIYFDTRRYFAAVIRAIDAATESIDVEMYIFSKDRLGLTLLESLERAAQRRVRVRVVIDGVGSPEWSKADLLALGQKGIQVRVYHPVPRPYSKFFSRSWPEPGKALQLLRTANRRNHKKLFLIDRAQAFVGSMNVSLEHSQWRETSVHVEGADVGSLEGFFLHTWHRSHVLPGYWKEKPWRREKPVLVVSDLVRTNVTRRLRKHSNSELLARVHLSQHRVWLTSAYFIPSPRMIRRLILAAGRGVDVRLLLPRQSDVKIVRWVSMLFYQSLLNANITIYEYLPSILHAKTLLVDDWVSVGTSNLNHRSYYHDLELDLVLSNPLSIKKIQDQFLLDVQQSEQVTSDWLRTRPVLTRIAGYTGSILKNLM